MIFEFLQLIADISIQRYAMSKIYAQYVHSVKEDFVDFYACDFWGFMRKFAISPATKCCGPVECRKLIFLTVILVHGPESVL